MDSTKDEFKHSTANDGNTLVGRSYVFHVWRGAGKHERYEKTEDELTKAEKDLLLGELIQKWENNTKENQLRFMQMIMEAMKEKQQDEMFEKLKDEGLL